MFSNKNVFVIISLMMLSSMFGMAQLNDKKWQSFLKIKEDSLQIISQKMVFEEDAGIRFRSDSQFVRTFIRALQSPHSFQYTFDSLNISKLFAPDSSFKIFTWEMKKDEYVILQKGAIQMRTKDGSLKLYPLFDNSMFTRNATDSIRNRSNWIGAIYYKIIATSYQGKSFYTLLGFDDYTVNTNRKWIDVLQFDAKGEPQFGGIFNFRNDSIPKRSQARVALEYKKEAKCTLRYDEELQMIIFDHLISESNEPEKKFTYVPDGDYEGFQWSNGQWLHINKVFNFKLSDGQFPLDKPVKDNSSQKPLDKSIKKSSPNGKKQ